LEKLLLDKIIDL